jgi:hypothetical protein
MPSRTPPNTVPVRPPIVSPPKIKRRMAADRHTGWKVAVADAYTLTPRLAVSASDTNGAYLRAKPHISSFPRKRESSDFGVSEALDPRFRGDDELK